MGFSDKSHFPIAQRGNDSLPHQECKIEEIEEIWHDGGNAYLFELLNGTSVDTAAFVNQMS